MDHVRSPGEPIIYQIMIEGLLDPCWSEWFGGLTVTPQKNGQTLLAGPVRDQAALHGLLAKIRDMGLPLISVNRQDASVTRTKE